MHRANERARVYRIVSRLLTGVVYYVSHLESDCALARGPARNLFAWGGGGASG